MSNTKKSADTAAEELTPEELAAVKPATDEDTSGETPEEAVRRHNHEPVTVTLFRDSGKYRGSVFVAVNGKRWQIQRGVPVKLPRYAAMVLQQSLDQDMETARLIDDETSRYQNEVARELA